MKLHELKIKEEYWHEVNFGEKTFELRKNDRDYQPGDLITFKIIDDNCPEGFAINDVYKITYVLKDVPEYGLKDGYCILAIKRLETRK